MTRAASRLRLACAGAVATVALGASGGARAGDGRIEINQALALAGGVTPGDPPGFPVELQTAGSYVLTSDLVNTTTSAGIAVRATGPVTVDLAGFTLRGPATCTGVGSSLSCSPVTGYGIDNTSAPPEGTWPVIVRNGRIEGYGVAVISPGDCLLSNLEVRFGTVSVGGNDSACIVRNVSVAYHSVGMNGTALLLDSLADGGFGSGFLVYEGTASVLRSSSRRNGLDGVDALFPVLLVDNAIDRNERNGVAISAQGGPSNGPSLLIGNSTYENALRVAQSAEIKFASCVTGSGYTNNVITPPAGGATVLNCSVADMDPNVCNGVATCP